MISTGYQNSATKIFVDRLNNRSAFLNFPRPVYFTNLFLHKGKSVFAINSSYLMLKNTVTEIQLGIASIAIPNEDKISL